MRSCLQGAGGTAQALAPSMADVGRHRCSAKVLASSLEDPFRWPEGARPRVGILVGPVCPEEAKTLGLPAPVCSCLLEVEVDRMLRARVLALIPADAKSYPTDTAKILVGRLKACKWLDDMHFLRGGHGPGYRAVNGTTYSQPRRVTWSVLARQPFTDADGDLVFPLFAYPASGRSQSDMRCRPMPMDVFELGLHLWKSVWLCLGSVSLWCE